MLFRVLKCWDAEDLFTYGPLLAKLLQTDAAVSNPLNLADGIVMTMLFPGVAAGDMDMICQNTVTFLDLLLVASKTHEGTPLGRQCMIQCMGWTGLWFDFTIGRELEKNPKFDPGDMFGEKGSLIDKVYAAYNYESDLRNLTDTFSHAILLFLRQDAMCCPSCSFGVNRNARSKCLTLFTATCKLPLRQRLKVARKATTRKIRQYFGFI